MTLGRMLGLAFSRGMFTTLLVLLAIPHVLSTFEVVTLATSGGFSFESAVRLTGTSSPLTAVAVNYGAVGLVDLSNGVTTLLAGSQWDYGFQDGPGADARFGYTAPYPAVVGERIVLADSANLRIRLVDFTTGDTSTLAGNGDAGVQDGVGVGVAQFCNPGYAAHVPGTNYVLIADGHRIRKIDAATGDVSTVAGLIPLNCVDLSTDTASSKSTFGYSIHSLAVGSDGLTAYVANRFAGDIFRVSLATGSISRLMQRNQYNSYPSLVVLPTASDAASRVSRVMVADLNSHFLWTFEEQDGASTTSCVAAGSIGNLGSSDGKGTAARFNLPENLALMAGGTTVVVWEPSGKIRLVDTTMASGLCEACSCVPSCMPPTGVRTAPRTCDAKLSEALPSMIFAFCRLISVVCVPERFRDRTGSFPGKQLLSQPA